MRIALASCADLPDWEVDDHPFHDALRQRGIHLEIPAWTDDSVDWSQFDGVLIRTTWDYTKHCDAFVAWARRVSTQTILLNSASTVAWNTHKTYLKALEDAGVRTVPTAWFEVGDRPDLHLLVRERGWKRAFIKPVIGATAEGTFRVTAENIDEAQTHLHELLTTRGAMVQPYRATVETDGEVSALLFEGQVSHCVQKVPLPGDYRVQDDFGAADHAYAMPEHEIACAQHALKVATDILGECPLYARADFLRGPDGLEMNELELVEPSLFFRHDPESPARLADVLLARIRAHQA